LRVSYFDPQFQQTSIDTWLQLGLWWSQFSFLKLQRDKNPKSCPPTRSQHVHEVVEKTPHQDKTLRSTPGKPEIKTQEAVIEWVPVRIPHFHKHLYNPERLKNKRSKV
jgi:hypothetical protein